jgi:glycosyltransferase involved in cell wall biosynthesis
MISHDINIPCHLWHIWIGPKPAPTKWMETWPQHHPGWQYSVFDNQSLAETKFINQHLIDEYMQRGKFNGAADLIRYELLYRHGGLIPPADAVCFCDTTPLWDQPPGTCYTVYESETIRPGFVSPIYAAEAGDPFVKILIDTLNQIDAQDLGEHPWQVTGNAFVARMIEQHQPKIKIFPSHYFIPTHFLEPNKTYVGPDRVYADQKWGSTNQDWAHKDVYALAQIPCQIKPVRTCVYAIALNEIKHVDQFMQHCEGADLVLVCDTGSTDGTPQRLRELGAVVYDIQQSPWRFDHARNTALNLIPGDIDICLSIDLDEYLQPGWHQAIEKAWQNNQAQIKRIRYDYVWNWMPDGVTANTRFYADKIHHRHGFHWRHPCHETLYWIGAGDPFTVTLPDLVLHHRADNSKSRSQYLPLLKQAVTEDPHNDRMAHYYARELLFNARWQESIEQFERHLNLPTARWHEERAASWRYISRCYRALGKKQSSLDSALKGIQECATTREPWLELARAAHACLDWATVFWAITRCLSITTRSGSYMADNSAWGWEPYDHGALAAHWLGLQEQAKTWGQIAIDLKPGDPRLLQNLKWYQGEIPLTHGK